LKKRTKPTIITTCTQKNVKFLFPQIPESVIVVEDMLGFVPKLKYVDHDVTEVTKFMELAQNNLHGKKGKIH
jgi:hypothetical protein